MLITVILISIWALLMLRSGVAEYKYYKSVKILEPEIWEKLGAPKFLKVPLVFVSTKGSKILKGTSNETVRALAVNHRQAGIQFLSFVVLVLVFSIVYFKIA